MIDPKNITKYDRTQAELEEFLLFAIVVAGKNSQVQAKKLEEFLNLKRDGNLGWNKTVSINTTFDKIQFDLAKNHVSENLKKVKMGQYSRLYDCFFDLICLNNIRPINTWTFEDLTDISGIGPKTAHLFLLHTKKDYKGIPLDTHLLKWLRSIGYDKAPKATPQGKHYRMWEVVFLNEAKRRFSNHSIAEVDLEIWKYYSGKEDSIKLRSK